MGDASRDQAASLWLRLRLSCTFQHADPLLIKIAYLGKEQDPVSHLGAEAGHFQERKGMKGNGRRLLPLYKKCSYEDVEPCCGSLGLPQQSTADTGLKQGDNKLTSLLRSATENLINASLLAPGGWLAYWHSLAYKSVTPISAFR